MTAAICFPDDDLNRMVFGNFYDYSTGYDEGQDYLFEYTCGKCPFYRDCQIVDEGSSDEWLKCPRVRDFMRQVEARAREDADAECQDHRKNQQIEENYRDEYKRKQRYYRKHPDECPVCGGARWVVYTDVWEPELQPCPMCAEVDL